MDFSNGLGGLTGTAADTDADPAAAAAGVQQLVDQHGGVDGLLQKLRAGGLGDEVGSWVSTGPNEPVEPEQLQRALGHDTVSQLSSSTGISIQSLLPILATFLPLLINHLTPRGQAPQPGTLENQPDLGSILGGVLGGVLGGR